jgi:hypothetical protein
VRPAGRTRRKETGACKGAWEALVACAGDFFAERVGGRRTYKESTGTFFAQLSTAQSQVAKTF